MANTEITNAVKQFAWALLVIVVGVAGCSPKPIPEPSPSKKPDATPAEVAKALAWGKSNLLPIISWGMKDPEPGVAVLINKLVAMAAKPPAQTQITAQSSVVQITMGAQPDGPGLAWTLWSEELHKVRITLSVPDLRQYQSEFRQYQPKLADKHFRDMILAILCHETIHLELRMPTPDDPKGSSAEGRAIALDAEAIAWRRTVIEVIRPFRKAGRYVTPMAQQADEALRARGDRDEQAWRDWVRSNLLARARGKL